MVMPAAFFPKDRFVRECVALATVVAEGAMLKKRPQAQPQIRPLMNSARLLGK